MKLKDLAIDHPYYCNEGNYYSNEAQSTFDTMADFLDEMGDSDVDMNLVFRWDVRTATDEYDNPTGNYSAEIFIMHQRKGRFWPMIIKKITEEEVGPFVDYLKKHWNRLNELWAPVSSIKKAQ
jgi:hypothetical protein